MSGNFDREMAVVLAAAASGAAMFRFHGSSLFARIFNRGATTARIVAWALPMAMISLGGYPGVVPFTAVAFGFWLGAIFPWWQTLSLGRVSEVKMPLLPSSIAAALPGVAAFLSESSWRRDAALHAVRGVLWVIPPAIAISYFGGSPWPLILSGLMCVPCYEIGWRAMPRHATEIGELLFGSMIGAAAAVS